MSGIWRALTSIVLLLALGACSYLKYASVQAEYARIQEANPGQINLKHMIDRETHYVIGRTVDDSARYAGTALAVAAFSSRYRANERVDTMFFSGAGTHFGLNLPEGDYRLLVFADLDRNRAFDSTEVVGETRISVNRQASPDKVLDRVDIARTTPSRRPGVESFAGPARDAPASSLFYPSGSIRSLDDPLFAANMATLGMYDPASFLEMAPTTFYALEEDLGFKIPVVFVHGIGGSVRNFRAIIDRLDRSRYKPWFYYYPSGGDLDQLAELFHRIFLSGEVVRLGRMPMIIVAHSMGGLIVREALNKVTNPQRENPVRLVVTIASPFGGHAAAATGEKHGLIVLPSWRDLNPESRFIGRLFRKPLPEMVTHRLVYAYRNPAGLKVGENSDGVVALSSQLRPEAQQQAAEQRGFEASHVGILQDEGLISDILARMQQVKNFYPQAHLEVLQRGGYGVTLSDQYGRLGRYLIGSMGRYLMAISRGRLEPISEEQVDFLRAVRGEAPPSGEVVSDWLRFLREYPDIDRP
ncbi:MAG: hypothetical protein R3E83_14220 [Burkholderiaceae bacterium]